MLASFNINYDQQNEQHLLAAPPRNINNNANINFSLAEAKRGEIQRNVCGGEEKCHDRYGEEESFLVS